jgi:5'(3')-deoxyribonucleotidase
LLYDDSDLDKYPLVKEFGQKCIIDLKNVLDAYVKEVEGRIKSYMDSYLKVSGSDIDKERAEDLVSLYHILYDGAKERNYHVVLEAFKIHIEKMKKNGSSMLFSTASVCVTAAYQWLKDNYGAYHKQYDAFILETLRLVMHKKHRSELNEMKLAFENEKNSLGDDKSQKINSLESEIKQLKAINNTLLSEKDELVKQVGVLSGEKKSADEKVAKSEDQIKGLVKAFHQVKEKKNLLKAKVETLNVDNNKLILGLSERHASNMHTLFESSLKEMRTVSSTMSGISSQLESLNKHVLNQGLKK